MSKIFLSASHFHKTCCNKTKARVAFLSHKYKRMSRLLYSPPPSPFKHLRISLVERSLPRRGPYRNRHRLPPHHRHGCLRSGASGAGGRRHFHRRLRQAFCRPFRPDRLRAEKRCFEENREVWRALEDAHLTKSEDHRRFQLPPRQPAEPPCRLPRKKPAPPPHHQHRPAASGFLPEPRDLSGNLLPIAHSEALKDPAIQKMAEKYAPPLSSASAAL